MRALLAILLLAGCETAGNANPGPPPSAAPASPASSVVSILEAPVRGLAPLRTRALRSGLYQVRAAWESKSCKVEDLAPVTSPIGHVYFKEHAYGGEAVHMELFFCGDAEGCGQLFRAMETGARAAWPLMLALSQQDDIGRVHGRQVSLGARCEEAVLHEGHVEPLTAVLRRVVLRTRGGASHPDAGGACDSASVDAQLASAPCKLSVFDIALSSPLPGIPCRERPECRIAGQCTDGADECVATKPDDCQASDQCRDVGRCTVKEGECQVGGDADCAASRMCRERGLCRAFEGIECVRAR